MSNVPAWPFAVLVVLVAFGLWQRRTREVSWWAPAAVAAAFVAYSIYGVVSSFGIGAGPLLAWAVGLTLALVAVPRVFAPVGLVQASGQHRILVPGSWLPLTLMLGIFLVKFAVGFVAGARLAIGGSAWFPLAIAAALGILSGGFAARALAVFRFAHHLEKQ